MRTKLIVVTSALVEAFFERAVKRDGCWDWTGGWWPDGYPALLHLRAARVAWAIFNGDPGAKCVLHSCDNPRCCNPEHLFLGTKVENNADHHAKGRSRGGILRGEDNPQTPLTTVEVLEIRRRRALGESQASLGRAFGVARESVRAIVRRQTWCHV